MTDKLTKARVALVQSQPFFGSLLLRMQSIESTGVETMGTDGKVLLHNPAFVDGLQPLALQGVLAHETLHVALSHHLRRGGRDKKRWNIACDYAVNPLVLAAGFELPDGALVDDAFKGMSAEAIYRLLPESETGDDGDEPSDDTGGDGDDPGGCGSVMDHPADGTSIAEAEAEIAVAVAQAANVAKAAGRLPSFLEEAADQIKRGHVNWREQLRRFCQAAAADDYRWNRPARRHLGRGIILPSQRSERMGEMVIAIDTSGSIDDQSYDAFVAESLAVAEDLRPERLHVVWCDTRVQKTESFDAGDFPSTLPRVRGGGTMFQPVFDWVEQEGISPACLVYLTDLYADTPAEPDYPVMWAASTEAPEPFGEVVRLNDAGE